MYRCNDCNNEFEDEEISTVKRTKMVFSQGKFITKKFPVEYCPGCMSENLEYEEDEYDDEDGDCEEC